MKISLEDVTHIAKLSRLSLTEQEAEMYAGQLSKIIDYVEQLNNLDTSSIEPTSHIMALNNIMAEDVHVDSLPREEALRNGPDSTGKFYRVRKIIE